MFDDTQAEVVNEATSQTTPVQDTQPDSYQARNFTALREYAARMEREAAENKRMLNELYNKVGAQSQNVQPTKKYEDSEYIYGTHLNEYERKLQDLERKVVETEKKALESEARALKAALKMQYPDIDSVVTEENIQALRAADPDLVSGLAEIPDHIKQAKVAYTMIKKHVLNNDTKKQSSGLNALYDQDHETARRNVAKPKPIEAIGGGNLTEAGKIGNIGTNGSLSDDEKKILWRRMQEAKRRVG